MELIKPVSQQSKLASVSEVAPSLLQRLEKPKALTEEEKAKKRGDRLFSLDLLRGIDIFFLTVVCVVVAKINESVPLPEGVMKQFLHAEWIGFTVYDMIMPLFIFMCGAALPLALSKRLEDGHAGLRYWLYVFKRVALLWVLGMIVQGRLLSFNFHEISFFNNTLQAIAVGYLITAIVSRVPSRIFQIAVPFALAAGYTVFLHMFGDMTPGGNAAVVYETKLLKLIYPAAACTGGSTSWWWAVRQISDPAMCYTWWTTIPMFGAMALAGFHATNIALNGKWDKMRRANAQIIIGICLAVLGVGLAFTFDPCIKHIYTASFTAIAMGISFVLYGLCYFLCDYIRFRIGLGWLATMFGGHSLLAYMLVEMQGSLKPDSVGIGAFNYAYESLIEGLAQFLTPGQCMFFWVVLYVAVFTLILAVWNGFKRGKVEIVKAMAIAKAHKASVMV